MKTLIGILTTDWHIDTKDYQETELVIGQLICLAKKLNVKVYNLGDTFESRKAQPLQNLKFFEQILNKFKENDLTLDVIPGNHDKVNLSLEDSYLDPFKHYPNINLCSDVTFELINDCILICKIPFFDQLNGIYQQKLDNALNQLKTYKKKKLIKILLTHIAIDGVKNNDGTAESNDLKKDLFDSFDQIFVGHYHNKSDISDKIHYIGSIKPKNFGEDNEKGFHLLYDNGETEFVKANFKKFEKISLNIENITQKDIKELIELYKDSPDSVRIEFKGDASMLKSIDVTQLEEAGIDVKVKQKSITEGIDMAQHNEVISFDKESILTEFDDFCLINNIETDNKEYGLKQLNKILGI